MTHENTKNIDRLNALPTRNDTWALRHHAAVRHPETPLEIATVEMLRGWLRYADAHLSDYGFDIGENEYIGALWAEIGVSLRGLLDGGMGRLDVGIVEDMLRDTLKSYGFDVEAPLDR